MRHPNFETIYQNFLNQYGQEAMSHYRLFLTKNSLDETRPYDVHAQYMTESFKWIRPTTVEELNQNDPAGSYYRMRAITANMSMNKNDYSNIETLMQRASSLSWRPLNHSHDHNRWLPFPEYRIHYATYEDKAVETIIRVPRGSQEDLDIQEGKITHPSIEGFPLEGYGKMQGEVYNPETYTFVGAALLHKGEDLPGDPLTTIDPLTESLAHWVTPITEAIGTSFIESLSNRGDKQVLEKTEISTNQPEQTTSKDGKAQVAYLAHEPVANMNPNVGSDFQEPNAELGQASVKTTPDASKIGGLAMNESEILTTYLKANTELKRTQAQQIMDISEARSRLIVEQQEHTQTKRRLNESLGKVSSLEKEVLELIEAKTVLQKNNNDLLSEKSSLEGQVSAKTRDAASLNKQLNEARSELQKTISNHADLKESHTSNLNELNKVSTRNLELAKENQKLQESTIASQKEVAHLSEELAKITRENADLTEQRANLAKKSYVHEKENAELRATNNELNEQLHKLKGMARKIIVKV